MEFHVHMDASMLAIGAMLAQNPIGKYDQPIILYINSVSLSVSQSIEVLKPISLLIKLSPRTQTRGPKNYSRPRVFTSYFYVRFCTATAVVDGGGIFGIWRVGEEIWVPKNYSRPRILTYFYFYVCFHATTAVVDGGGIFGIWRVGEEIWVRFFWAKGLGGS